MNSTESGISLENEKCTMALLSFFKANHFFVDLVNEENVVSAKGVLKVSVEEVVFSSKSSYVWWPLEGIRKYGFQERNCNMFFLVAGRRCPHGPGLYRFRCRDARAINCEMAKVIHKSWREFEKLLRLGQVAGDSEGAPDLTTPKQTDSHQLLSRDQQVSTGSRSTPIYT